MSAAPKAEEKQNIAPYSKTATYNIVMFSVPAAVAALIAGLLVQTGYFPASHGAHAGSSQAVPSQAQVIDQKSFLALPTVLPATQSNGSTVSSFILGVRRGEAK